MIESSVVKQVVTTRPATRMKFKLNHKSKKIETAFSRLVIGEFVSELLCEEFGRGLNLSLLPLYDSLITINYYSLAYFWSK